MIGQCSDNDWGWLRILYKDCDDTVLKSLIKNTISFCLFVCLFVCLSDVRYTCLFVYQVAHVIA